MTSAAEFIKDLKDGKGFAHLESHLLANSYVTGGLVSAEDFQLLGAVSSHSFQFDQHPSVARWFLHMSSFSKGQVARITGVSQSTVHAAAATSSTATPSADADDFDPFGDEPEPEASKKATTTGEGLAELARKKKEADAAAAAAKPSKKVIDRSTMLLDIRPTSSDVDMRVLEEKIREITLEGLRWAEAPGKTVPFIFGMQSLKIGATIVDDLVGTDEIINQIRIIGMTKEDATAFLEAINRGEEDDDEERDGQMVSSVKLESFQKL